MQNWDDLKYLLAIARRRALGPAARELGVNQSTVFRRLNAFEKNTGVRMFERLADGYTATVAGEAILRQARRIEEDVLSLERLMTGQDYRLTGVLRITTVDDFAVCLMPALLTGFRRRFPDIELQITAASETMDLARREADVAIRPTRRPPEHLVGRRLGGLRFAWYGTANYLRGRPTSGDATDLNGHRIIAADAELATTPAARWISRNVVDSAVVVRANSMLLQMHLALADVGLALLPEPVAATERRLRKLVVVDALDGEVWALTHPDLRHTARVSAFMGYVADQARQLGLSR